jgi:hypothetical protein
MKASAEVRLELLRLTYTHGREASEAVDRAKILESYITQGQSPGKAAKKAEKPPG